ncbi:MAG: HAMP domain-containing sensor histidine kinase [Verrucomicrobiota bacterium]|jgi:heavy metal sensor kinase
MSAGIFTKSIKWRLLLWMAVLLASILTGLGVAVYEIHLSNRIGRLDEALQRRVGALGMTFFTPTLPGDINNRPPGPREDNRPSEPPDESRPPGPPNGNYGPPPRDEFAGAPPGGNSPPMDKPGLRDIQLPVATASLFASDDTNGFYFILWSRGADLPFKHSADSPAGVPRPQPAAHDTGTFTRTRESFREAFHVTERGDYILVGRSMAAEFKEAKSFAVGLLLGGLSVMALVLIGAWWLIGRALQPVEKISAAALKISSGDLSQRISVPETESELGELAAVLNSTFSRLETSFALQKQFTSDAAHELRTPLAVLISEAQTTLARDRSPADYRDALNACLDAGQKMRQLTGSLLELARLDAGQEMLHREKIDLASIAQDCMTLVQPLAAARNLQVHCDLMPAMSFCDPTRIAQVVTNLLSNAITYNREGGRISVTTRVDNDAVSLSVADTGCGISAADLPRVFKRFYQADKSRSTAGNGLGLSICQAIVEAHGGTIRVTSEENVGTTFLVNFPKAV